MKNRLLLNWHVRKKLFVHILSSAKTTTVGANLIIWAHYRLGMYKSVLETDSNNLDWRAYFAKIISYAAIGEYEESKALLNEFNQCRKCKFHGQLLVNALAPYMSETALNFKNIVKLQASLEVALLIKIGETETALEKVTKLIDAKFYRSKPELLLYYSNLDSELVSKQKLTLLNKFLLQFGLTKVRLKEVDDSLSINNLKCSTNYVDKKELVSIIMTTYNSSEHINSALTSVLMQSYINLEVIVVDDCSNDNTTEIIESFVKIDDRVKLIKLKNNVGTYVAKNIALQKAKGIFVTCHDSDDFSHPLKIERQVFPLLKNSKLIASISDWIRIDERGNYYTRYVHPLMRLNLSSLMYRKNIIIQKIGYYDSVRTGADSEFYSRISLVFGKKNIKRIKQPLSFGSHRENSLMTAKDTGYNDASISNNRLEYWESWNKWHIDETSFKRVPYIPFDEQRTCLFEIPKELEVKSKSIELVKNQTQDEN